MYSHRTSYGHGCAPRGNDLRNLRYVGGRTQFPLVTHMARPQTLRGAAFMTLKGEVDRMQRLKAV